MLMPQQLNVSPFAKASQHILAFYSEMYFQMVANGHTSFTPDMNTLQHINSARGTQIQTK